MMSRPVCGVRNSSVIVTLPGSPKGARENLEAIIKMLPHACLQASGANSRSLHAGGVKKLEKEAGVSSTPAPAHDHGHHHHHHDHGHRHGHGHGNLVRHTKPSPDNAAHLSNDPSLGPTRRHRESPYPMKSVEEALSLIAENTPAPEVETVPVDTSLVGAVLASDVRALESVPAFRASIVDGYAVVVPADGILRGTFPVVGVSHAAPGQLDALREGTVARITTGAPLPPGATSVIMVEDTTLVSATDDGSEEREVAMDVSGARAGDNVREVGSDVASGDVVLRQGDRITGVGGEIGLLASVGVTRVDVYRRPVVGVLSTGDELVDQDERPSGALRHGEVRDTNRLALLSAAREHGFPVVDLGIARDKASRLEETLRDGLRAADVVVTSGGVSMGELDLLKPTLERALGGTIHFGRVAMKPGKPTTFATVPAKDSSGGSRRPRLVFSLPGNPASALVTFHLFVLPSLHKQAGHSGPGGLPKLPVVLAHDFPMDPRPEYHRAVVTVGPDGLLSATSTGGQRSSKVGSLRAANALVCMPSGKGKLDKGSRVDALIMGAIQPAVV